MADDDAAVRLKEQGNEKLKAGDGDGAISLYLQALKVASKSVLQGQLHSNCAHVLLQAAGKEEEALSHCEKAIASDPSNVKAFFRGATAAQRLERHDRAIEFCTRGIKLDSNNKDLRNLLKKSKAKAAELKVDVEAARREVGEAERLFGDDEASGALSHYDAALSWLGAGDAEEGLRQTALQGKARCHLELGEYWPAVLSSERALAGEQGAAAALCEARALRELGLLHTAEEKFGHVLRAAQGAEESIREEAEEGRGEVLAAMKSLEAGEGEVVMQEVERLQKALPEKEAVNWMYTVKVKCESEEGRQEMLGHGFLKAEWLSDSRPNSAATYTARCMQKLLLYQVKKRLQQELSVLPKLSLKGTPNGGLGVSYTFATPASLRHPSGPALLRERHVEELRARKLTVIDEAFDEAAMAGLRKEIEWLDKVQGILLKDDEDVCNPLQRRFDIPLADKAMVDASRKDTPVLFAVIDHLRGLPAVLEDKLGLELRVPETTMLACYPKGAFYRKHLDSYNGEDIPRKVTILLYCNPEWNSGDGGCLKAWLGGEAVEVEPRAGRIVVFMAQEVWHEVTESRKERYALTQWVWDVKKDKLGR